MRKEHKGIIQRKCEEVEGLRMRIEEKETMDAVKAAADAAEAKGIVKCTVEEIDAWEKEYDEKNKGVQPSILSFYLSILVLIIFGLRTTDMHIIICNCQSIKNHISL